MFVTTRAAFARTGPLSCVPRRHRSYSALRLPCLLRPWLCSRSLRAYLDVDDVLVDDGRIHSPIVLRDLVTGFPQSRSLSRRDMGLPGSWAILFRACRDPLTPPAASTSSQHDDDAAAFDVVERLGNRNNAVFGADSHGPRARVPTYRRQECRSCRRKARYRSAGLGFDRAGFAPAGRRTAFLRRDFTSLPCGPAFPGHTHDVAFRGTRHGRRPIAAAHAPRTHRGTP